MSLFERSVGDPRDWSRKLHVHALGAALGSYLIGQAGFDAQALADAFALDAGEQAEAAAIKANFDGYAPGGIERVIVLWNCHSAFLLAEEGLIGEAEMTAMLGYGS